MRQASSTLWLRECGDPKSYHTRHILTRVQSNKFILSFVKKCLKLHGMQKTQSVEQNWEDIF